MVKPEGPFLIAAILFGLALPPLFLNHRAGAAIGRAKALDWGNLRPGKRWRT